MLVGTIGVFKPKHLNITVMIHYIIKNMKPNPPLEFPKINSPKTPLYSRSVPCTPNIIHLIAIIFSSQSLHHQYTKADTFLMIRNITQYHNQYQYPYIIHSRYL